MKTKIYSSVLLTALLVMPLFIKAQWNHVRFDQYNTFSKVFTVTADTAFVIGAEPTIGENFIVRTNDGGATWDSIHMVTSGPLQLLELYFADVNNGFTGGYKNNSYQTLLKTNDNGTTWTEITPDPFSTSGISAIYFLDALNGFASSNTTLYSTTNGGSTWTSIPVTFYISDLNFTDMNNGTASGSDGSSFGVIMRTNDGGQTWTSSLNANDPNLFVSNFDKENKVSSTVMFTALQYTNKLFRTTDGGLTWNTIVVDSVYSIRDFQFSSATSGHVLSDYGQIFTTNDGGLTWALEYATEWGFYGPSIYLYSFSFVDDIGYVAGTSGLIKKHDESTMAINESVEVSNLNIYPNPLSGSQQLNIQTKEISGDYNLEIVNAFGQVVFTKAIVNAQENLLLTIPILNLATGAYSITIQSQEKRSAQKLMIVE